MVLQRIQATQPTGNDADHLIIRTIPDEVGKEGTERRMGRIGPTFPATCGCVPGHSPSSTAVDVTKTSINFSVSTTLATGIFRTVITAPRAKLRIVRSAVAAGVVREHFQGERLSCLHRHALRGRRGALA